MNFHETKMGAVFFNCQLPELIKALREIADALKKPAPAALRLADTGEADFLHNLFCGNYEPDIYGCTTAPSELDRKKPCSLRWENPGRFLNSTRRQFPKETAP